MIKYTTKKIGASLVLAICLVVAAGFNTANKKLLLPCVSVCIEQQNADVKVLVKAPKNTSLQFYMFNSDGSLIKQLETRGTQKFSIGHLSKGFYSYQLFNKDERLKSGDVQIK